jgi:hypothetical protein
MLINKNLALRLEKFKKENRATSKGSLSVLLTLTRNASKMEFPLSADDFRTEKKGQVAGLGGGAVKTILKDHGIDRTLSEEGGRTSRGSMGLMEHYVTFLNTLYHEELLELSNVEKWWVENVKKFFASQPIRVKADVSKSLRQIIQDLLDAALERQRECSGTMVVGAVLEHLVGAKLSIALPEVEIPQKNFSAADAPTQAKGDFLVGDTAIHVTVAPAEALVRKCKNNLGEGLRPLVVTTESGVGGIRALAENADIANRIDILEVGQFITINVYEWIGFRNQDRSLSLEKLVAVYNKIVEECETDPSLKISLS